MNMIIYLYIRSMYMNISYHKKVYCMFLYIYIYIPQLYVYYAYIYIASPKCFKSITPFQKKTPGKTHKKTALIKASFFDANAADDLVPAANGLPGLDSQGLQAYDGRCLGREKRWSSCTRDPETNS